ncbi:MAG: DNA-binding protein [Chitinophagales bacterium]
MQITGMNITFNELRKIKDSLPDGSIHKIAETLDVSDETVRNYFGGYNYEEGQAVGIHFEPGPDGGVVHLDDARIIEMARQIIEEQTAEIED